MLPFDCVLTCRRTNVVLIAIVTVLLTLTTTAASAQDAIPASLLRKLAETADAERTGRPIWIVVRTDFPHDVAGVHNDSVGAVRAAAADRRLRAFGPYATPPDLGAFGIPEIVVGCAHDRRTSYMMPQRSMICAEPVAVADIRSMTLVIETTARGTVRVDLPPNRVDAVFLNVSAYDKFLSPYYSRLYGPERAGQLRAEFLRGLRPPR